MRFCFTEFRVVSRAQTSRVLGNVKVGSIACHCWKPSFVRRGNSVEPASESQLLPQIISPEIKVAEVCFPLSLREAGAMQSSSFSC